MEIITSLLDLGSNLLVAGDSNGVLIVIINNINKGMELHEWVIGKQIQHPQWVDQQSSAI